MRIERRITDEAVLRELGERLARMRLGRDLTQRQLSEQAGVSRAAVQRIELGEPVTTPTLVRVLRALDGLDALDQLVPEPAPSPIEALKLQGRQRQRASGAHRSQDEPTGDDRPWRWGDQS